jgi:hypothetical protein
MQRLLTCFLGLCLLALVSASCGKGDTTGGSPESGQAAADLLLLNGYVYTSDGQGTVAEAVAVNNGLISAVGRDRKPGLSIYRGGCFCPACTTPICTFSVSSSRMSVHCAARP